MAVRAAGVGPVVPPLLRGREGEREEQESGGAHRFIYDISTAAHQWHSGGHDGHGEHVGIEREIGHVENRMDVRHVVDAVLYMARLPLDANVQFMTVLATKMPSIGRG